MAALSAHSIYRLVCTEARSVSCWAFCALSLRIGVHWFLQATYYRDKCHTDDDSLDCQPVYENLSVLAGWALKLVPAKVAESKAPGFLFASPWLLSSMLHLFGTLPSVPLRICEMVMGRLTPQELAIVLPVHFLCTLSTLKVLCLVLPTSWSSVMAAPVVYSTLCIKDLAWHAGVDALFCIGWGVLPELCRLNRLPLWVASVAMLSLYNVGIDANGMATSLSPPLVYALSVHEHPETNPQVGRLVASMVGGLVGGKIMTWYFPDDS